jgi:hypothetical protein
MPSSRPFVNKVLCVERLFHTSILLSQPNHLSPVRGEFGSSKRRNSFHIVHAGFHHLLESMLAPMYNKQIVLMSTYLV